MALLYQFRLHILNFVSLKKFTKFIDSQAKYQTIEPQIDLLNHGNLVKQPLKKQISYRLKSLCLKSSRLFIIVFNTKKLQFKQALNITKEAEIIYQWIKINYPDRKPQKIIQQIYDYTYIGKVDFGQIEQIQLKASNSMKQNEFMYSKIQINKDQVKPIKKINNQKVVKVQATDQKREIPPQQQAEVMLDQLNNIRCDSTRQFKGYLLESLTSQKEIQSFKNQKKIVHVFTKKGYGIQHYQEYLNKRKLDQKQWKFFRQQLVKKNLYQELFQTSLRFTIYSMEQFLKASFNKRGMRLFGIKEGPFQRLLPHLINLQAPFKDLLNRALKVTYELNLKQDAKIEQREIWYLHKQILKISKKVQRKHALNK